jgi:hypothetical protein
MNQMAVLVAPSQCKRPDLGQDGHCRRCGRRARYEPAYGRVVHVRGRLPGVSYSRDAIAVVVPLIRIRRCPDCDAQLQESSAGPRCPWTTTTRARRDGDVIACDRPSGERQA